MSICIYSIGYPNQVPPETFHSLLSLLPTDAAAKVRRYHHWQDAYGSLFGKLLLMTALAEYRWPGSWLATTALFPSTAAIGASIPCIPFRFRLPRRRGGTVGGYYP
ncbi:MAG TPA: hypothetical protein VIM64_17860 [Puia sp.]